MFLPGWEEGLFPHQRALDDALQLEGVGWLIGLTERANVDISPPIAAFSPASAFVADEEVQKDRRSDQRSRQVQQPRVWRRPAMAPAMPESPTIGGLTTAIFEAPKRVKRLEGPPAS